MVRSRRRCLVCEDKIMSGKIEIDYVLIDFKNSYGCHDKRIYTCGMMLSAICVCVCVFSFFLVAI